MAFDIALPDLPPLPDVSNVTKTYDFIPYLRLQGASSELVKRGQFPMGHFSLSKPGSKTPVDMGTEIICVPIHVRPKASCFIEGEIDHTYDENSDQFKTYAERAKSPGMNGYAAGPEWLFWSRDEGFITYHLSSPSTKRISGNLSEHRKQPIILTSVLVEQKHVYHAPEVLPYNGPAFDGPSPAEFQNTFNTFTAAMIAAPPQQAQKQLGRAR